MEIDTVLVKVSSRCNINCSYCYVYNMGDEGWKDMPTLISPETISHLCNALAQLCVEQRTPFATVLHGGEPLMLGARRLELVLSSLRAVLPSTHQICIQTNGMLITNAILDICASNSVTISVSLDGPKPINDKFRIGHKGESTFDKVVTGIGLLRTHASSVQLFSGLLCVIDPFSDPGNVYHFLKSLGAPSIDFLYRDGNHSKLPFGKRSFESTEYGEWLIALLEVYLADGSPIKIRFLDDMMKIALGGRGVKEGIGQTSYGIIIVESDGTLTKNDTLKSTFHGADRFDEIWSVKTHRLSEIAKSREFGEYHELQKASAPECKRCSELALCGGGMPLHRWKQGSGFQNPSVYCSDQKILISNIKQRLTQEELLS